MAIKLVGPDGNPVKYMGKEVMGFDYAGVIKSVDVEKRKLVMIGTDESRDRDGDIIRMAGWNLENYRKNPVFLWAHNYGSVPIARAEKVIKRQNPLRMEFQLVFPTKSIYPFADMILELYGEKIINTSSVGFIPYKWEPLPDEMKGEDGPSYGTMFTRQELLELSGCAVPSNPNAIQNALKGKTFGFAQDDLVKYLSGGCVIPRPEKEDDILEELEKASEFEDETVVMAQVPDNLTDGTHPVEIPLTTTGDETVDPPATTGTVPEVVEVNEEGLVKIVNLSNNTVEWIKEEDLQRDLEGVEILVPEDGAELKPYPNEHACRIADPADFDKFARKNCYRKVDNKCVDYIFGIKDNKTHLQAFRFDKEVWTEAAARKVCERAGGSFEAAKPEKEASKEPTSGEGVPNPEEGKDVQVKVVLDTILEKLNSIDQTLRSLVEDSKGFQASLTKVIEESQRKPDSGEDSASFILRDAFRQGKPKPESPPAAPVSPYKPESVQELRQALVDFTQAIKSIKL